MRDTREHVIREWQRGAIDSAEASNRLAAVTERDDARTRIVAAGIGLLCLAVVSFAGWCGLSGCAHVHPAWGGAPGVSVDLDDAPARHSDGGPP